jgi:hypothetical protein
MSKAIITTPFKGLNKWDGQQFGSTHVKIYHSVREAMLDFIHKMDSPNTRIPPSIITEIVVRIIPDDVVIRIEKECDQLPYHVVNSGEEIAQFLESNPEYCGEK